MKILSRISAIAALALVPAFASAAPIPAGEYAISDYNVGGNPERTIWTPQHSGDRLVTGGGASRLWSFSNGIFDFDGSNATLTARATNTGATELQFDVNLSFALTGKQDGYCQFKGVVDKGCDNGTDYVADFGVNPADWTYFDFLAGTFTGLAGTVMEAVTFNISDNNDHRPQAGLGANALEESDLGFSMWFLFENATGKGQNITSAKTGSSYYFSKDGSGDINADLTPLEVAAVPLPAAGWMLIAGLGGLAAAGRRRKQA